MSDIGRGAEQRISSGRAEPEISSLADSVQSHFRVEAQNHDRATVLAMSGELDLASAPTLEEELEQIVSNPDTSTVILDLRQLEFMDSTGLSALIKAHQRAQEAGQRFGVVRGGAQVQRLLDLTGIGERITLVDAPEELLDGG